MLFTVRNYSLRLALASALNVGCVAGSGSGAPQESGDAASASSGPNPSESPNPPGIDAGEPRVAEDSARSNADAASPGSVDTVAPPAPPPQSDAATPAGVEVVVNAGAFDRENAIVSFPLPSSASGKLALRGSQGEKLPVQPSEDARTGIFSLPSLKAGTQARFTLEVAAEGADAVTAVKEEGTVKVAIAGAPVFRYQLEGKLPGGVPQPFLRGGYIHPLFSPGNLQVTDDYPSDHAHHHGIWSAWAHSRFEGRQMDFWNMRGGSAKVDFDSLATTWSGPVHGGFRARHVFVDLRAPGGAKTALREEWRVTAYKTHETNAPYFVFDIDSTQDAATAQPVMLDQYTYGGFAFRGSAQWRSGATFLTSEGLNRQAGDGSKARWCYIGGRVDGKPAGYAVLGHPSNFRAPQPLRLNPDDPYFSFSPVKPSGFAIEPGKPFVTRFRVVVLDGEVDRTLIERLWNDYATPPEAKVK